MPLLQVVSATPVSGKTTVAVGLAQGFARAGETVDLVRTGASAAAEADATTFAARTFASSTGKPVTGRIASRAGQITIAEVDTGEKPGTAPSILVVRERPNDADVALAKSLGENLVGSIATLVAPAAIEAVARDMTNAGLRPLALLPEDRILAGPGVDEIRSALGAELLSEGENALESVDDIVIAPVFSDPASPHFIRYEHKAVLTPSYKTDLQLAAIESGTLCLIVTGGRRPSHYVLDRVQHEPTTVLLAPQPTTFAAVNALSDVWTRSRFRGQHKADVVFGLLQPRIDFAALARKLK